jgi:hypothetical protein
MYDSSIQGKILHVFIKRSVRIMSTIVIWVNCVRLNDMYVIRVVSCFIIFPCVFCPNSTKQIVTNFYSS